MTVGIVEPVGGHGGMDYYGYGLSLGLGANGITVRYYTCDETHVRDYENVITLIYFRKMWKANFLTKVIKYLSGHFFAFKDIKRHSGKIIHLHFFTFRIIDVLVIILAKIMRLSIVLTVHDVNSFDNSSNNLFQRICYSLVNEVIIHNQSSFEALNRKLVGSTPITIIPHGNYLPFIGQPVSQSQLQEKFTILFFGQIKRVKGLDLLLKAIEVVKNRGFDIILLIAGKPWKSDITYFEDLIKDLNIEDIVKTSFRYILDEEVSEFYSSADIVVLPYREIYQSGVLLLTMSYGKPVICSDLKPFKEIIQDGYNGILFKNDNHNDLANKIIYALNNRNVLSNIVTNSNCIIREKFDWIKIGENTIKVYKKLY